MVKVTRERFIGSWGLFILFLILFWPAALIYYFICRESYEIDLNKTKIKKQKKIIERQQKENRYWGYAIAGFICSFFAPILGIIFSIIALKNMRRDKGLAKAGLIISIIVLIIHIIFLIAYLSFI